MAIVLIANLINALGSFVMIRLSWKISTEVEINVVPRISVPPLSVSCQNSQRGSLQ